MPRPWVSNSINICAKFVGFFHQMQTNRNKSLPLLFLINRLRSWVKMEWKSRVKSRWNSTAANSAGNCFTANI